MEGTSDHPFDMSASSLSASVPDPSSIGMAGAGEASYGGRRRRQHSRHGSLCLLSLKMMGGGDEEGGEPGDQLSLGIVRYPLYFVLATLGFPCVFFVLVMGCGGGEVETLKRGLPLGLDCRVH